jgi:hypothetical protein
MEGSSSVIMAMNDSREGEGVVAVRSLMRCHCLVWLGMAQCGRLAVFFAKINYVCRRATNAGNNYIVNL